METTLIFLDGFELPCFASFPLLEARTADERRCTRYFEPYLEVARPPRCRLRARGQHVARESRPGVRSSATRSTTSPRRTGAPSRSWRRSASARRAPGRPIVISAPIGAGGRRVRPESQMTVERGGGVPLVAGRRSRGHARRPRHRAHDHLRRGGDRDRPGRNCGQSPGQPSRSPSRPTAVCRPGSRSPRRSSRSTPRTDGAPAYFMVNCAHPTHFLPVLDGPGGWDRIRRNPGQCVGEEPRRARRVGGARRRRSGRARARTTSRSASDSRTDVLGGCCGTDHRHVGSVADAWFALPPTAA